MLVLKRLDDAERDGDRVYAVIRASAPRATARGSAIYAPSAAGQVRALRRAYEPAGFAPGHGRAGRGARHRHQGRRRDRARRRCGRSIGETGRPDSGWCALGSVKSQIGHTKAAAGAAGLIKAALALHHKVLPPTIKVRKPIPASASRTAPST